VLVVVVVVVVDDDNNDDDDDDAGGGGDDDAVNCYVELRGFGRSPDSQQHPPDLYLYKALALNGFVHLNATDDQPPAGPGIFTYVVDVDGCSASDLQEFNTHGDDDDIASDKLINYLTTLASGRLISR